VGSKFTFGALARARLAGYGMTTGQVEDLELAVRLDVDLRPKRPESLAAYHRRMARAVSAKKRVRR
jgi:hypothetical protein